MAADIRIYGWRKPTLDVSLAEGGTLDASTLYYVLGVYGFTPYTYCAVGGPVSDVYEITTTGTARSIVITQTTYRDVSTFTDNGDGRTNVVCERHCFADGEEVKFASGSYTGTYNLEKVDYHNFIIDASYVDSSSGQCYSDTYQYNVPTEGGTKASAGMVYWVYPTHPNPTGNNWSTGNYWTKYPWYTSSLENPLTVSATPVFRFATYSHHPELSNMNNGTAKACKDYGSILVQWESGAGTLGDIYDAVMTAGFPYNCGYNSTGVARNLTFELAGSLRANTDAAFNVTGAAFTIWGEFNHNADASLFTFNNCSILYPFSQFTGYQNYTANDSVVFNNSTSNSFGGWIYGNNTLQYVSPRTGYDIDASYWDNFTESVITAGIIDNKEFKDIGAAGFYQMAYNARIIKNTISFPFYWVMQYNGAQPDIYMMENVTINEVPTYDWGIRYYSYNPYDCYYIQNYLNVDEYDRYGVQRDRVRCVHNSPIEGEFHFWRTANINVQSGGVLLEDVSIFISDNSTNTYAGITDASGNFSVDLLEQTTRYDPSDGILSNWVEDYDTMYNDFNITISKEGYDTETYVLSEARDITDLQANLVEVAPLIYVDREISGSILNNNIEGSITDNSLSGSIINNTISGVLEVED